MNDKDVIRLGVPGGGIIGTRIVEKRINGDVVDTRTGSFTHKYISSFFLVVEDDLAKKVIDIIASDFTSLPRRYINAGVWGNQAACLFGFLMYAKQLEGTNIPQFSILAIDDGDVKKENKEKRLNKLLKGNYYGDELKLAKECLSDLMLSFNLEYVDCNITKGLPEYNHKKWFEEIDEKAIISISKPSGNYEEGQVEGLLDLIEFSKSIILDDYHLYYEELKKCPFKNTLDMFNLTQNFVLTSIKKYNNVKWQFYTGNIKEALAAINEKNRRNFIEADVYFKE